MLAQRTSAISCSSDAADVQNKLAEIRLTIEAHLNARILNAVERARATVGINVEHCIVVQSFAASKPEMSPLAPSGHAAAAAACPLRGNERTWL